MGMLKGFGRGRGRRGILEEEVVVPIFGGWGCSQEGEEYHILNISIVIQSWNNDSRRKDEGGTI